jgi:dihydroxyacetone kinase
MKKLINRVEDVLSEQLAGLAKAHPELTLHQDPVYVTRADAPVAGKVALLSGGGSGRADALRLYWPGHAFRRLPGRNFHLPDAG